MVSLTTNIRLIFLVFVISLLVVPALSAQVLKLVGSVEGTGEYSVAVHLGTQPLKLQVDTGYSGVVVYGSGCSRCPETERKFVVTEKGVTRAPCTVNCSCDNDSCGFAYHSATLDYKGTVYEADFQFTDILHVSNIKFGVVDDMAPWFPLTGANGKLGLHNRPSQNGSPLDFPLSEIYQNETFQTFGLCFGRPGYLYIGMDPSNYPNATWVNYTITNLSYGVVITDIMVNTTRLPKLTKMELNGPEGKTTIDSGTKYITLPTKAYKALADQLSIKCATPDYELPGVCGTAQGKNLVNGYCFDYRPAELKEFPPIKIAIEGAETPLVIDPSSYLVRVQSNEGVVYCLAIVDAGVENRAVLGQILFRTHMIIFDNENQKIGFVPITSETCPTA